MKVVIRRSFGGNFKVEWKVSNLSALAQKLYEAGLLPHEALGAAQVIKKLRSLGSIDRVEVEKRRAGEYILVRAVYTSPLTEKHHKLVHTVRAHKNISNSVAESTTAYIHPKLRDVEIILGAVNPRFYKSLNPRNLRVGGKYVFWEDLGCSGSFCYWRFRVVKVVKKKLEEGYVTIEHGKERRRVPVDPSSYIFLPLDVKSAARRTKRR